MLYRALTIFVVGFWLTMIGLLIRKEGGPGDSALREVPVGHIVKLLLIHEQTSDLNIYNEKMRLGHLTIHPKMPKGGRARVIEFSGYLQIVFPGFERERISWDGELELEKDLATRRFKIGLTLKDPTAHDPSSTRAEITVAPAENLLTWALLGGGLLPEPPHTYTLDHDGLEKALHEMDPAIRQLIESQTKNVSPPVVKAHQSSMIVHGERMDTFLVTIEQSGQTLLEFDVDQLGQILRAKTLIGYSFAPEDLVP